MGVLLFRRSTVALVCLTTVSAFLTFSASGEADVPVAPSAAPVIAHALGDGGFIDPIQPVTPFRDERLGLSVLPPRDWLLSPATSIDRAGDPETFEVVRYQLSLRDSALYAQPLPVTSGLLADAGAVLSLSLAREGSDLLDIDLDSIEPAAAGHRGGVSFLDGETTYDGVVTFTRILVARESGRTVVVRAFVAAADRDALAPIVQAAIASATLAPAGPNGPVYVAPAPPAPVPAPEPAVAAPPPDPSAQVRAEIVARAAVMLGTPYVWGGSVPGRGMDCSAYVSAAWGVSRYSTDSIWNVAVAVGKEDILPGDAMDLETWRDPSGYGHIRLFEAWANAAHTLVWVYEETPPRAIHRVIAYDARYQPIRLAGLSGDGIAPLVAAPAAMPVPDLPASAPRAPSATRRPSATVSPTVRPTRSPRPLLTATPRPLATPRPVATPTPTPRNTAVPTATVRPTPLPTPRPAATARSTAQPATTSPRRTASPTRR